MQDGFYTPSGKDKKIAVANNKKDKSMSKVHYILPLALLVSGVAHAVTDNPWYVGARIGGTHFNNFDDALKGSSGDFDQDDWGGGAFLGYNITPWFALEGGYTYLGKADYKPAGGDFDVQGIDLLGKFTWALTDSYDLYAKAGGYVYNADNSIEAIKADDDGIAATVGVGVEYFYTDTLSTRLEYQYYNQVGDSKPGTADIHFYGLSLVYHWGAPAPVAVVEPEPEPVPEPAPVPAVVKVDPITVALPFGFDSNSLSQVDIDKLEPIAKRLENFPETELFVIGHTDSRGSEEYNQKLSEDRAEVVAGYLASHFGIDQSRFKAEGKGETQPVANNDTEAGRAQNRRVEVFTPGFEVQGE